MLDPQIEAHYALALEESRLFTDGRARLEFVRTLELLNRLLPKPPARILDVGGGTGVYAVPLCERGYSVHLVDAMALHADRATEIAVERSLPGLTASVGDARDLGDVDRPYDAVLLLGPLYHLTDRNDRVQAWREAIRVAQPGAAVIGAGISRFASLIDGLKRRILSEPTFRSIVEGDLRDGQHRNPDPVIQPEYFTTAYFHLPDELEAESRDAGLTDVELLAIEGPGWIVEDGTDMDAQLFAARAVESERALMAATSHMLVVGTTPTTRKLSVGEELRHEVAERGAEAVVGDVRDSEAEDEQRDRNRKGAVAERGSRSTSRRTAT